MSTPAWIIGASFAFIVFVTCCLMTDFCADLGKQYKQWYTSIFMPHGESQIKQTMVHHAQTIMLEPAVIKMDSRNLANIEFAVAQHTGTLRLFLSPTKLENNHTVLVYCVYTGPGQYTLKTKKNFSETEMIIVPVAAQDTISVQTNAACYYIYSGCSVLVSDVVDARQLETQV